MTKLAAPELVTIPNVPLIEAGMDWPAMTGPITITREHLVDMVAAANDDPTMPTAKLKLTRVDDTHGEPITEPSFGRVTNLRMDESEQTVYGDFEGLPKWLAAILPAAYPQRSVEILWGLQTPSGGNWKAAIESVQLLGVEWPGCFSLADLPLYYGDEQPETVVVKLGGAMAKTAASMNADDVRRSYYDYLMGEGNYSWWIKGILLDDGSNGNQLVVEDEAHGELYLVSFSVDGDEVEFDEPTKVKIEYVPVPEDKKEKTKAVALLAAGLMANRKVLAAYATPEESGREKKEGGGMTEEQRQALAKKLGLSPDATEQEISTKLLENAVTATGEAPNDDPDEGGGEGDGDEPATPATPATPAEPTTAPTTVPTTATPTSAPAEPVAAMSVDPATLAQLQADAKAGREARQTQLVAVKETLLSGAIKQGKFPPARKKFWSDYYDRDPEGAKQAIDGLAANLIPIEERGVGSGGAEGETDFSNGGGEAYPTSWFPEVAKRRAALKVAEERGSRVSGERLAV